jgi:nitrite reductase/ring-hydroxylating ferredoxin subunit
VKRTPGIALAAALVVALAIVMSACSGGGGPVRATWVNASVQGDTATIPLSTIEEKQNVHFRVPYEGGAVNFMAYVTGGAVSVRANVCPPCRSIGFTLDGKELVCDTCRTTFESATGDGIQGACVDFPKAPVAYAITRGNVVMQMTDLAAAYENTLVPGRP